MIYRLNWIGVGFSIQNTFLFFFGINRTKFCIQYRNSVTKKVFNCQVSADVLRTIKHDWVKLTQLMIHTT